MTWVLVVGGAALVAVVGIVLWRGLTLFELSIANRRVTVVRGHCPAGLLDEIRDIVKIGRIEHGTIRVMKDGGEAKVVGSTEIDDATMQRIRNVMARVPVAKLRAARRG